MAVFASLLVLKVLMNLSKPEDGECRESEDLRQEKGMPFS
jgi:hypothetical protein